MKVVYKFEKETVEIEVSEKWANIVFDLDRQEYNNDHKETRRHCSFEVYSCEGHEVADKTNVEEEALQNVDYKNLYKALEMLEPRQRYLIEEHFFKGRTKTAIAEEEGVTKAAVRQAIERAVKKLRKFLV